ncbi:sensor histidine kinase [Ramlibacter sp. USB13]|uniref:histidine kinase n=1 Tax=Ramlibacter cellulosilyticus TaxID=2764187 RepID=A0A923MQR2_9BURK|nr:sensor histidine kinase [Ramlibacter cellulosilyticus]MBC5782107.1 sensor histidine kinase [Ramlibacter cellulosilyticus]
MRAAAWLRAVLLAAAGCLALPSHAAVHEAQAARLLADAAQAPPAADARWQDVTLPDLWRKSRPGAPRTAAWYQVRFEAPAASPQAWAVFFPFLDEGGQVWLNGALLQQIPENTPELHVRWMRPHLVALPPALLRPGANELLVRVGQPPAGGATHFPRVSVGPLAEVARMHDRRYFWVSITPQITAAVCLLVSLSVLFIWWRRPAETMYGLFGVAVALWGLRTLTFVVEALPVDTWFWWRVVFHSATGGFIVAMTALAWRLAGIHKPWFERALFAYWLVGPLWLLAQGPAAEPIVNRWWVGGFLPIGATIVGVSAWFLVRRRTLEAAALPVTMAIAALAGMHDYLITWDLQPTIPWLASWTAQRFQLMHLCANFVLLAMGGLLTARFVRALHSLEDVNKTLEQRVADREEELAGNYVRVFALERENAAAQERQRIMRDLHDGLGSGLFVLLSRVERSDLANREVADALRGCIADMRLALDTLAPQEHDFRSMLGNFLFRWRNELVACGIHPRWEIAVPDEALQLSPHAALQLLRVAQEALTNVVKHAGASEVHVQLRLVEGQLELEVRDNGIGAAGVSEESSGRGLTNMRTRATQLGGRVDVRGGSGGTRVTVQVPLAAVCG